MTGKASSPKQPSAGLLRHLNRVTMAHQEALDSAQSLAFDAMDAPTKAARLAVLEESLLKSPICADAWGILAQEAPAGSDLALLLWRQAVAAGLLGLGPLLLELAPEEYWLTIETRPYIRARHGLATELWRQGQRAAAIAEAGEVLALNPDDNLGLRYALLDWLLADGQDTAAAALHKRYEEDSAATWAYGAALLAFRQHGAGPVAEAALAAALRANPHVAAILLGRAEARPPRESYEEGSPAEAGWAAPAALPGWQGTPGALEWLAGQVPVEPAAKPARKPAARKPAARKH